MRVRLALGVAAVLLTSCGGAAPSTVASSSSTPGVDSLDALPPYPAAHGRELAIARGRELVVIDDGGARSVTTIDGPDTYVAFPRWSPDGSRVAFVRASLYLQLGAEGGDDVFEYQLDTGETRLLRPHVHRGDQVTGLDWTPDGQRLVVGVQQLLMEGSILKGFDYTVEEYDPATDRSRILLEAARDPSVSRNGLIAYVGLEPGGPALRVQVLDGSNARDIEAAGDADYILGPRIAPDGSAIAFAAPILQFSSRDPTSSSGPAGIHARLLGLGARRAEAHGVPMDVWRVVLDGSAPTIVSLGADDPRVSWDGNGGGLIIVSTLVTYEVASGQGVAAPIGAGSFNGSADIAPRP